MRAMRGQQILQTLGIVQIVEQGHGPHFRMAAVELNLGLVEIEFAMVQQHQFGGWLATGSFDNVGTNLSD